MLSSGFLNPDRLRHYRELVDEEIKRFESLIATGAKFDLFRTVSKMVVLTNLRVILGHRAVDELGEELAEHFYAIEEDGFTPQMMLFKQYGFLPFVARLNRRRERLLSLLGGVLQRAFEDLQAGVERHDYATLVVTRFATEFTWRRYAIHILAILFAAHTNTAGSVFVLFLGRDSLTFFGFSEPSPGPWLIWRRTQSCRADCAIK